MFLLVVAFEVWFATALAIDCVCLLCAIQGHSTLRLAHATLATQDQEVEAGHHRPGSRVIFIFPHVDKVEFSEFA